MATTETAVERDEFDELEDESWDVEPDANAPSDVTFQVTVDRAKVQDHLGKSLEFADKLATQDETLVDHIKIDEDGAEDEPMVVGEFFDPYDMPATMAVDSDGNRPIMRPQMNHFTGLDMTGEDISDPAVRERRKKRAARFGIEEAAVPDVDISSGIVNDLRTEFGIDLTNEIHQRKYRLDTLHVCGVSQMSTFDITQHFATYMPENVEWIDDQRCNIVCRSVDWASRCLLAMTKPLKRVRSSAPEEGEVDDGDDDVARVKQEVPEDTVVRQSVKVEPQEPAVPAESADVDEGIEIDETQTVINKTTKVEEVKKRPIAKVGEKFIEVDVEQTDVPPGRWRVVITPHKRSTVLLVRYANVRDVKEQGAQHRSDYYARYGNPNYAPMQGLLSKGMKERLKAMRGGPDADLRNRVLSRDSLKTTNDPFTQRHKVRPGLNMFDDDGNELEWDWEHDTRFYDDQKPEEGGGRMRSSVVSRKRGRDDIGERVEKRMRMDDEREEIVDEKPSRISIKSRLGGPVKSLLDTVPWRQLPFNDDETLSVTKSLRTGERTATTGVADWSAHDDRREPDDQVEDDPDDEGEMRVYGQVGREQDDELAGAAWHVGARKRASKEPMLARVDPESAQNTWTAPDDVRRMRVTIDNEHAQRAAAAKPSVQKSVRDRLGKEKPKRDSGRVEKKDHRSKHRREREKKSHRTKTSIMLRDDKKSSKSSKKSSKKSKLRRHPSSSSSSSDSSSSSSTDSD